MCPTRHVLACMLACALLEVACGLASIALGAASVAWALRGAQPVRLGHGAPLWSGVCFLLCGVCGVFCAKRKSGRLMILFSALCICGLIAGILSFRFVWVHDHSGGASPNLTAVATVPAGAATAGETAGATAGATAGETAAETAGATAGWTAGTTAGETAGETAGATAGWTAGKTAGETAGATAGTTAGWTAGWTAGTTAGWTAGVTAGETAGTAAGATAAKAAASGPVAQPPRRPRPAPPPRHQRSWRGGGGAAGRPEGHVAVASLSVAGVGVAGCAASAWLTCRLARNEQRRMFVEMEHSLHHTHELTERELAEVLNNGISPVSQGSKSF
ncbi:transmembrane protein 196 [Lethenteron reissneri]|uniref:transmembrane protein 196 n=1 Tax=Lethenteron reissneri TaxID=7753 RepID=UPI002AB7D39E|nr:transmembrane protein 196 [Lethenteron reissneri]